MEMEEEHAENVDDVAPALIAVHPLGKSVVVAVGTELRAFDLSTSSPTTIDGDLHVDFIRSIKFARDGTLIASGGDDKLVKIWNAQTWKCQKTVHSEKRVNAVAFSWDAKFLVFADKFGVVWITTADEENCDPKSSKGVPFLAHCCSIITGLGVSPGGQYLATSDRDFKIRVSVFPENPLAGAHEIQSFCLGHRSFVSCVSFLGTQTNEFLVSGGGDATVRLWNYSSGELLDTFEIETLECLKEDAATGDKSPPVSDIAVRSDGLLVAVAIERFCGVLILSCEMESKKLSFPQCVKFTENFVPRSIAFNDGNLWMVMGAAKISRLNGMEIDSEVNQPSMIKTSVTCLKLLNIVQVNGQVQATVLEETAVPGSARLIEALQVDNNDVEAARVATEEANAALKNLLLKREYSMETRENRKKNRNDKKTK